MAPNAAVMSWRGTDAGIEAAKHKHHVVMAPQQYYYLNMYQDAPMGQPKAQGGYTRLDKIYSYNPLPIAYKGTDVEKYMDGVQACVWTEFISELIIWSICFILVYLLWQRQDGQKSLQVMLTSIEEHW